MSINDKKQVLGQGGAKPAKPDTSIFGGKPYLTMNEAIWKLKQASPAIPNAGGATYSRDQIRKMAEDVKNDLRRYGAESYMDPKKNLPKYFKDLKRKEVSAPTTAEKIEARKKMDFLSKHLLGK
ncbi:MAG: hypothetical protein Q7S82_00750 [bacterium]|nr:hypothetical protein [bacterium]